MPTQELRTAGISQVHVPNIRSAAIWAVGVMSALSLVACGKRLESPGKSIRLEKEVVFTDLVGQPEALAKTDDGGFVIAGGLQTGWAARTNAEGEVLWKFQPRTGTNDSNDARSEIHGAVALPGGRTLLCGALSTKDFYGGVIWILDDTGTMLDQRRMVPQDDARYFESTFLSCFQWGSGIGLLGRGTDGKRGIFWLVRVNARGDRQWERTDNGIVGLNWVVTPQSVLYLSGSGDGGQSSSVARLNEKGEVEARWDTHSPDAKVLQPTSALQNAYVLILDKSHHNVLQVLDDKLVPIGPTKRLPDVNIRDGAGFVLNDGSVILFGSSGAGIIRSAIGWGLRPDNMDVIHVLEVPDETGVSYSFRSAVQITADQFVAVRNQASREPSESGVVLSWVAFQSK